MNSRKSVSLCIVLLVVSGGLLYWRFSKPSVPNGRGSSTAVPVQVGDVDSATSSSSSNSKISAGHSRSSPGAVADRARLISMLSLRGRSELADGQIFSLLLAEAKLDPSWVFETLKTAPRVGVHDFYGQVLDAVYKQDPALFMKCVSEIGVGSRLSPEFLSGVCGAIYHGEGLERGISALSGLYKKFDSIGSGYLETLALDNAGLASGLIEKLEIDNQKKSELSARIASIVSLNDPETAFRMIENSLGSSLCKQHDQALYNIMRNDPGKIAQIVDSASDANLIHIARNGDLVNVIAERANISELYKLLDKLPLTASSQSCYEVLMASIFKESPTECIRRIGELPSGGARNAVVASCWGKYPFVDAASALESVSGLSNEDTGVALRSVARVMAGSNFEESLTIASHANQQVQQDVYREVARASSYQNSENAIKFIEDPGLSEIIGSGFRSEMIDHTVRNWANKDLGAAQQWVEKLSEEDAPKGVSGLMTSWMKSDPVAASEWLSKLPAGPARDAGARQIIQQMKDTDPEMAAQWRNSLTPAPQK